LPSDENGTDVNSTISPVTSTLPILEKRIIELDVIRPGRWGWWPRTEDEQLPEQKFTIAADGIVEIPLEIPADVTSVSITVRRVLVCFNVMLFLHVFGILFCLLQSIIC